MAYAPATDGAVRRRRGGGRRPDRDDLRQRLAGRAAQLRGCGVASGSTTGSRYYIHAKLLIADGRTALVSSQNLSTGSLKYNRELGITVTDPAIVSALEADFDSDYAGGQPVTAAAAVG